jgi:hypothetical protein
MSLNEMKKSITEILSGTNREVMLMSASGVPEDLEKDKFQNAISLFKEASQ